MFHKQNSFQKAFTLGFNLFTARITKNHKNTSEPWKPIKHFFHYVRLPFS